MDKGDRTEDSARDQDIGSHSMVSLRLLSVLAPIEVLNLQCRQIYTFKATDIDCRHFLPGPGGTFAKRMNAT